MPRRLLILLGLLTLWSSPAFAQEGAALKKAGNEVRFRVIQRFAPAKPTNDFPARLAELLESRQWDEAHNWLAKNAFSHPHADFLKGYVAFRAEEPVAAQKFLGNVKNTLLDDYARFYAAQNAFAQEDYAEVLTQAAGVKDNRLLEAEATWIMGQSLAQLKRYDDSERAYRGLIANYPSTSHARKARMELATRYFAQKRWNDAARLWLDVRQRTPINTDGVEAQTQLQANLGRFNPTLKRQAITGPNVVLNEYRARVSAHQSDRVVRDLPKAAKSWKKGSAEWCEAQYLVGRSYTKLRKHGDSTPWYGRVIASCSKHSSLHRKALYNGGKGKWNAGDKDGAIAWFTTLWETYPKHSYADDAYYFAARIHREQGNQATANALIKKQVEAYPDGDMAKDSHWLIVRQMFAEKKYAQVVAYIDSNDIQETDIYSKGRMAYFRARALQLAGKNSAEAYVQVTKSAPLTYYALLALNRLAEIHKTDRLCAAKPEICQFEVVGGEIEAIPAEIQDHAAFQRGYALVGLHLDELARREFRVVRPLATKPEHLWGIADLLDRSGAYPLSHDIARREIEDWETGYPDPNSRRKWDVAYPRPFDEFVTPWSKKRALPSAIAYAIMREESGFSPGIESWANARGLMQLMEATGSRMAKKDAMASFNANQLFEPEIAVRLGTLYLSELGESYGNHPIFIIAGYNGGAGNVNRWLKNASSDQVDLFVEDIPFGQTRNYTKRVLRTFWVYQYLSGNVVPRVSLDLPETK